MSSDKYLDAWKAAWRAIRQKEIADAQKASAITANPKPTRRRIRRVIVEEVIEESDEQQP